MDQGHSKTHLLQAQICLEREHYRAASSCLDQALSYDFSVRQSLSYYIIKAKILENSGDVRDSLQTLQAAMKMISNTSGAGGMGAVGRKRGGDKGGASSTSVPLFDKASVYIQMAQVLSQLNDIAEATRIVREALQVFRYAACYDKSSIRGSSDSS
jgi:tetratricopeptide repeat protein 21B